METYRHRTAGQNPPEDIPTVEISYCGAGQLLLGGRDNIINGLWDEGDSRNLETVLRSLVTVPRSLVT